MTWLPDGQNLILDLGAGLALYLALTVVLGLGLVVGLVLVKFWIWWLGSFWRLPKGEDFRVLGTLRPRLREIAREGYLNCVNISYGRGLIGYMFSLVLWTLLGSITLFVTRWLSLIDPLQEEVFKPLMGESNLMVLFYFSVIYIGMRIFFRPFSWRAPLTHRAMYLVRIGIQFMLVAAFAPLLFDQLVFQQELSQYVKGWWIATIQFELALILVTLILGILEYRTMGGLTPPRPNLLQRYARVLLWAIKRSVRRFLRDRFAKLKTFSPQGEGGA